MNKVTKKAVKKSVTPPAHLDATKATKKTATPAAKRSAKNANDKVAQRSAKTTSSAKSRAVAPSQSGASIKIWSWNVNGLRAAYQKGFLPWLESSGGDVVGVQETRSRVDQLPAELVESSSWWTRTVAATRAGYSGVTMFARQAPTEYVDSLGEPRFDDEGRFQAGRWDDLWIANVYFPNGNGKERDNSRVPYKLEFYRAVQAWADARRSAGQSVVVMGDFNTAHKEIDLARPKDNTKTSGFLPEERAEVDRWLEAGYLDSYRCLVQEGGKYSWWTVRGGARERNIGWRIDMLMISPDLRARLLEVMIQAEQHGSDHCPVGVVLRRA